MINVQSEIESRKNIISEATKQIRALKRESKSLAAERKGWADTIEKASIELELLEAGDVDGFQQTIASAVAEKDHG